MDREAYRRSVLRAFGANDNEIEELMQYNENKFKKISASMLTSLPLEDELFVKTWKDYAKQAELHGVFPILKGKLVQLNFPIEAGMSTTENYRAATRRGVHPAKMPEATGLELEAPEKLALHIHPTPAGNIPVLVVRVRKDFVRVLQALTRKNEPSPIPNELGAVMVAGYNNWDRIWQYKKAWQAQHFFGDWGDEFKKIVANKALYQDRLIILSDGAYSGVPATELQLSDKEWRKLSFIIRREHEVTHYVTQRLLGSMQTNMLDELIADFVGIVSAIGEYRADWFLRFIGLENFPDCRIDGRIHHYRSDLSDGAFQILQKILVQASYHLEKLNHSLKRKTFTHQEKARIIWVLAQFTLEEIASEQGCKRLETKLNQLEIND